MKIAQCTISGCTVASKYEHSTEGHKAFQNYKIPCKDNELDKVDAISKKGKGGKSKKRTINAISESNLATEIVKEIKCQLLDSATEDDQDSDEGRGIHHYKVPHFVNSISIVLLGKRVKHVIKVGKNVKHEKKVEGPLSKICFSKLLHKIENVGKKDKNVCNLQTPKVENVGVKVFVGNHIKGVGVVNEMKKQDPPTKSINAALGQKKP